MHVTDPAEVAPGVWQVREPLSDEVDLYLHLVTGPDGAALVDGGLPSSLAAVERLMSAAGVGYGELRYLLNTHAHHDHIGTFATLRELSGARLVAAPGAVRWIEDLDVNLSEFALHRPDIIPDSAELRGELAPTYGRPCHVDMTMTEGGAARLGGGVLLEAVELPGHVGAELGWLERSSRTLLLGDAVTGTSWTFFHGHLHPSRYRTTLHRLRALALDEDVQRVCMAHHASCTRGEFLERLASVEQYLDEVTATVEGLLDDTPRTLAQVWRSTCRTMHKAEEFRGLAMVEAHLREAVGAGRARRVAADQYVRTTSGSRR